MLPPNELSKEYITNIVINWLDWAKPFVSTKVSNILENVHSFSTLCHLNQLTIVSKPIINLFIIIYFNINFDITGIPSTLDCYIRTNFI